METLETNTASIDKWLFNRSANKGAKATEQNVFFDKWCSRKNWWLHAGGKSIKGIPFSHIKYQLTGIKDLNRWLQDGETTRRNQIGRYKDTVLSNDWLKAKTDKKGLHKNHKTDDRMKQNERKYLKLTSDKLIKIHKASKSRQTTEWQQQEQAKDLNKLKRHTTGRRVHSNIQHQPLRENAKPNPNPDQQNDSVSKHTATQAQRHGFDSWNQDQCHKVVLWPPRTHILTRNHQVLKTTTKLEFFMKNTREPAIVRGREKREALNSDGGDTHSASPVVKLHIGSSRNESAGLGI